MSTKNIQIISIVFLSLSIISLGFISSYNNYIDNVKNQHIRLVEKINSIKANLNVNEIELLKGDSSDVNNPNYQSLQQKLTALNNTTPDLRYIYLLGIRDSCLFFFIDSEPNNRNFNSISELAKPGEKYLDAPDEFYDSFYNKKEKVCKPYTDKWGSFVSVVSPISNSKNEIIALVGADVLNEDFVSVFQTKTVTPILLSVVLVLVFIILFFVFGQKYIDEKYLFRNIDKIKSALNNYTESLIIVNSDYSIEFINYSAKLSILSFFNLQIDDKSSFKAFIDTFNNKSFDDKVRFLFDNCTTSEKKYWYSKEIQNNKILVSISPILNQLNVVTQLIINIKAEKFNSKYGEKTEVFEEEKLILEHINEVVWQLNFECVIISVSSSVKQLLGYNKDEIIFKNMDSLITSESMKKLYNTLNNLKKVIEKKSKIEEALLVIQIKCKNGDDVDVESRIIIKHNQFDEAVGFVVVMRKVNENIDAIIELYETKKSIKTYFNHVPGILYRCAIDKNWTMKFISNGCFDLTGYSVDDFIENKTLAFNDIILPEFQELLWSKWQKVIEKRSLFEAQYQIKTANGLTKWVLEKGRCVYDESENPIALEGFIIDVSDKVKAEETIKFNEQRFRDYLESTSVCSVVTDKFGKINDFSTSFSSFLGVEKLELYKKPIFEIIDDEYLDQFISLFDNLKTNANIDVLIKIKVKDYSVFATIYASKVYDDEFFFYIVNSNEYYTQQYKLISEQIFLNNVIKTLPNPVYILDVKTRNIINKSQASQLIHDIVHCPCSTIKKNPNIICDKLNTECLINQMILTKDVVHGKFDIISDVHIKYYDVWVSPIFSNNDSNAITHAIISFNENTDFYLTDQKLNEASNSLVNIFSYHFKNLNFRMQRVNKMLQLESDKEDTGLYKFIKAESQNAEFLNSFLSNQLILKYEKINPEKLFNSVFLNVKNRVVLYKQKSIFFIDEIPFETLVSLNNKSFKLLFDYAINYTAIHVVDSIIKIQQIINSENKLEIKVKFSCDESLYNQLDLVKNSNFFEIFKNYKTIHQAIIDFAFLKKLCSLFNVDMEFFKQKSNEVICQFIFNNGVETPISNKIIDKKIKKIAVISSDKDVLNYLSRILEEISEQVVPFNDYLIAIKTFINLDEIPPEIIVIDDFVNNISAFDVISRMIKLPQTTKIVVNQSMFVDAENSYVEWGDYKVDYVKYPYVKSEFIDLIKNL